MHVLEAALFANLMKSPRGVLGRDSLLEPQVYWPFDEREILLWREMPGSRAQRWRGAGGLASLWARIARTVPKR